MAATETRAKFRALTEINVQAVLYAGDTKHPVVKEVARLANAYLTFFEGNTEKTAHQTEKFLKSVKRWPIETVAIELAASMQEDRAETGPDEKISSDTLEVIGCALFGKMWQTSMAEELGVSDRTIRRWLVDGAPIKIARELQALFVRQEQLLEFARMKLKDIINRPILYLRNL
jgi:hypothetical protein